MFFGEGGCVYVYAGRHVFDCCLCPQEAQKKDQALLKFPEKLEHVQAAARYVLVVLAAPSRTSSRLWL